MVPHPVSVMAVPPAALDTYKDRMRAHFAIPSTLNTSLCVACHAASTTSEAGRREHAKTGLCEACWDLLAVDDPQSRAAAAARCARLGGPAAQEYMFQWIGINRVARGGRLTCELPMARHIIAVATGMEAPPNVWAPGQDPQRG